MTQLRVARSEIIRFLSVVFLAPSCLPIIYGGKKEQTQKVTRWDYWLFSHVRLKCQPTFIIQICKKETIWNKKIQTKNGSTKRGGLKCPVYKNNSFWFFVQLVFSFSLNRTLLFVPHIRNLTEQAMISLQGMEDNCLVLK